MADWLEQAAVPEASLTPAQQQVLHTAFGFLQEAGTDYYSRRLLSHFLLHCQAGLKVAPVARLLGFSRSAASPPGPLLQGGRPGRPPPPGRPRPRQAPAALRRPHRPVPARHPDATRYDLLDFIHRTWGVPVSRMALYHFLKKYGLDQASRVVAAVPAPGRGRLGPRHPTRRTRRAHAGTAVARGRHATVPAAAVAAVPRPPPFFCPHPVRRRLPAVAHALDWLAIARDCFADDYGSLQRGLLDQRLRPGRRPGAVFHLDQMDGPRLRPADRRPPCPSRHTVGGWRRHLPWYEVDAFCRRTAPGT